MLYCTEENNENREDLAEFETELDISGIVYKVHMKLYCENIEITNLMTLSL